jgi:hypothetical protein
MKKRFLFINLHLQNVGYEYNSNSVHNITETSESPSKFAERWAKGFYDSFSHKEGNVYLFHNGEVAVSVETYKLITEEEYNVLKNFM